MTDRVVLGRKYRSKVFAVEGIATARTEYMTGCARVCLGYVNKDGEIKSYHFDETEIELVDAIQVDAAAEDAVAEDAASDKGGPGDMVPRWEN